MAYIMSSFKFYVKLKNSLLETAYLRFKVLSRKKIKMKEENILKIILKGIDFLNIIHIN